MKEAIYITIHNHNRVNTHYRVSPLYFNKYSFAQILIKIRKNSTKCHQRSNVIY